MGRKPYGLEITSDSECMTPDSRKCDATQRITHLLRVIYNGLTIFGLFGQDTDEFNCYQFCIDLPRVSIAKSYQQTSIRKSQLNSDRCTSTAKDNSMTAIRSFRAPAEDAKLNPTVAAGYVRQHAIQFISNSSTMSVNKREVPSQFLFILITLSFHATLARYSHINVRLMWLRAPNKTSM